MDRNKACKIVSFTTTRNHLNLIEKDIHNGWKVINLTRQSNSYEYYVCVMEKSFGENDDITLS